MKRVFPLVAWFSLSIIAVLCSWQFARSAIEGSAGVTELEPSVPSVHVLEAFDTTAKSFRIDVPNDALLVEIRLEKANADLDLYVRHGLPLDGDYERADHTSDSEEYNERFLMSRWDDAPLEPGPYYFDVVLAGTPRRGGQRTTKFDFQVICNVVRTTPQKLSIPATVSGTTSRANGFTGLYSLKVPPDAESLRIDLDADSSLNLVLGNEDTIFDSVEAAIVESGGESRKSIVLDSSTETPLEPGEYWVAVVDAYKMDSDAHFTLYTSLNSEAPAALTEIPTLSCPSDPAELAVMTTAELIVEGGGGSGVLISPQGRILTNRHVVQNSNGTLAGDGEVMVALTIDPTRPPLDLFRGRVVFSDEMLDMAIVEITTGYYGQPLPAGLVFPHVPVSDSTRLTIGQPITATGYPWIGGARGRVSLTMSRGIVSGFERQNGMLLVKTDADIHAGNSGGGIWNEQYQLIGIASEIVEADVQFGTGKMGLLRPTSLIPAEWLK